jgi:hypothetical protein
VDQATAAAAPRRDARPFDGRPGASRLLGGRCRAAWPRYGGHTPRLCGLARVRVLFPRTSERRTAPGSGLTGPSSAMQRRHRDDNRWAFPLAAPHSDITPKDALAFRPQKAELHVEKRGRIGCYQAGYPVCHWVGGMVIGTVKSQPKVVSMQTPLLGATALALVAAVNLSPARAEGPKPSGGPLWSGILQPVDHDAVPAHSAKPLIPGSQTPGHKPEGLPGPAF